MQLLKPVGLVLVALGAGCALFQGPPPVTLRFHEQVDPQLPRTYARVIEFPRAQLRLTVAASPALTENDVQAASLVETAGGPAVLLLFDRHGAMKLEELTTRSRGRHVVILLDSRPIAAVLLEQRLTTGQFLLDADFTDAQARDLVAALDALAKNRQRRWLNEKW